MKFIKALEEKMSKYSDKVPEKVKKDDNDKMNKYIQEKKLIEEQLAKLN